MFSGYAIPSPGGTCELLQEPWDLSPTGDIWELLFLFTSSLVKQHTQRAHVVLGSSLSCSV